MPASADNFSMSRKQNPSRRVAPSPSSRSEFRSHRNPARNRRRRANRISGRNSRDAGRCVRRSAVAPGRSRSRRGGQLLRSTNCGYWKLRQTAHRGTWPLGEIPLCGADGAVPDIPTFKSPLLVNRHTRDYTLSRDEPSRFCQGSPNRRALRCAHAFLCSDNSGQSGQSDSARSGPDDRARP